MKLFKKLDRKGFTLAEMLIVMAVVVVLAAAALPKLGSTIEGAKESNDLSTIADAYAEAYTKVMMKLADGSAGTESADLTIAITPLKFYGTNATWDYIEAQVGDQTLTAAPTTSNTKATFTFTGTAESLQLSTVTFGS